MSFLDKLQNQKNKLKGTETIVTTVDGQRYVEKGSEVTAICPNTYGFVVDTKPDNIPILVSDYLYIGSQDCAVNSVIEAYNIKHVLSLGIKVDVVVNNKFINCLDVPETKIKDLLTECLPFIWRCVTSKEYILVHCNAGVSRTSTVAIAYLIHYKRMTFQEAYDIVKSKRPAIQPNAGFRKQLEALTPGNVI
ncbi:probable dual specificity protein phosphatase DDB_G0283417 [Trichoplusia ni]|uniref:Probable dual specificity protein phosphatase DDB_G0283417 n=1 Tax=Trichoplusia ni TaxID=7111 RepID=A0A7E5WPR9_TRINI|nr:probable dual specificity protein phosphatase DDB_G0283417 [Trichoplusia ni]